MNRNQLIETVFPNQISLTIKREDTLHAIISGNKFRKLKYNLEEAQKQNKTTLVTFGGAFSNHILAVAGAGLEYGFETVGIIRGDELEYKINENPTLKKAQQLGMKFVFVTREVYKEKESSNIFKEIIKETEKFYVIPEGGTNALAIKGCEEILTASDIQFSHICTSVGTGGTIAGLINSSINKQQIIGFSSLKGNFLSNDIAKFANKCNWEINSDFHFGGYGKVTTELIEFINLFYMQNNIPLDPIYTGKMMFGIMRLIENNYFPPQSKILAIHTGGLQGIAGINLKLKKQNKTTLLV